MTVAGETLKRGRCLTEPTHPPLQRLKRFTNQLRREVVAPFQVLSAVLVIAVSAFNAEAQVWPLEGPATCSECAIELVLVATLGREPDSPIPSSRVPSLARAKTGLFYLIDSQDKQVHVFDSGGRRLRQIGRPGGGPGEYRAVRFALIDREGRIHMLDPVLGRHTVLAPDERVIEMTPLPGGQLLAAAAVLPSGGLVTNHILTGESDVGIPLQEIDQDGKRVMVFGGNFRFDANNTALLERLVWASDDGGVWVVSRFGYVLEHFGPDRTSKFAVRRLSDWFAPLKVGEMPTSGLDGRVPSSEVVGLWEDAKKLVWTATRVASPAWRNAGPNSSRAKRYNSIIEVVEPRGRGRLLASRKVEMMVSYSLGDGLIASSRELEDGTPIIEVWKVQLRRP